MVEGAAAFCYLAKCHVWSYLDGEIGQGKT